ncbi:MAG: hypothetical protein ACRDT6_07355 [Micromonosporaceae bacterium]
MPTTVTRPPAHQASPRRVREVFGLWCELTGGDPADFDAADLAAFACRPEVPALAEIPDAVLRDAADAARRGRSLPPERWLVAVRIVRPAARR